MPHVQQCMTTLCKNKFILLSKHCTNKLWLCPALHLPFFTPPRKARGWIESLAQKAQHQLPFFPLTSQAKQPHTKLLPHTGTENLSLYYNLSCSSFSFFFFFLFLKNAEMNEVVRGSFFHAWKGLGFFVFLFFLFCSCCIDHFYISTLSLHNPFFLMILPLGFRSGKYYLGKKKICGGVCVHRLLQKFCSTFYGFVHYKLEFPT